MDYTEIFAISAAGMAAERSRVDIAALNLANANAAQAESGAAFKPLRAVVRHSGGIAHGFSGIVDGHALPALAPTVRIEPVIASPRLVHEPAHPLADARGFVAYPGVDTALEMMTVMSATRAYEANVAALNAARTMAQKALDIGGAG